jgi:3-hydroxybutyryl-CoA dehydrogenase
LEKVGIYGSGNIGAGLATLATGNGFDVVVVGHTQAGIERFTAAVSRNWDDLIEGGVAKEENKKAAAAKLSVGVDPAALTDRSFVFEAVSEDFAVKSQVYARIETICDPDTIITSTTSSYTATDLAVYIKNKQRFALAHPFQPAHIQPLVEVAPCEQTADSTLVRIAALLTRLDRQVVRLSKDMPGLLVTRLAQAVFRESLYLIEQGVTTAEDIDKAMKWAFGKRYGSIGLLEYYDFVGYALESTVADYVYPTLCDARATQNSILQSLREGRTGYASGQGFYDWSRRDKDAFRRRRIEPFFDSFHWTLPE